MLHEYPYSIKRHGTTLEKCEDEPVQTPGCIQAHGVLLVLRQSDLTVLQVSENSLDWLGFAPEDLLGKSVAVSVGESTAREIRTVLDREQLHKVPLYLTTLQPGEQKIARSLHASLHTHSGVVLLELEAAAVSETDPHGGMRVDPDYYGLVRKTLTRFQEALSIKALSREITEEVRRITEMDRVMVYYFHVDYSGEVIAESKRTDQAPWLGFRYPAHDIPQPAREIFKKIWSRAVPDIRAELFEMVPLLNPDTRHALDMTYCFLRGASVMYTEYLDNMGVRAALTLPLMREGQLWGLIACHHNTPKLMSYRLRAAAEFLARAASQQLRRAEDQEDLEYRITLEQANYDLISKVALAPELSAFTTGLVHLGSGMDCGGAAIFYLNTWNMTGQTPNLHQLTELGRWLPTQPACETDSLNPIFVTVHLSEIYPPGKEFAGAASGLMAFCFSRDPLGLVLFFKPQTLQTLTWAGNPNELPEVQGTHGRRLSPRKSFGEWLEAVSCRSMPWKKIEVDATLRLHGLIIDMLVSRSQQINKLRSLIGEEQAKFKAIFENSPEGILQISPEGHILAANPALAGIFGYASPKELMEQLTDMKAQLYVDPMRFTEFQKRLQQEKVVREFQSEIKCRDGSRKWISETARQVTQPDGSLLHCQGFVVDITTQKSAQKDRDRIEVQLRQSQKLESIGQLAAGIAHEMNTPLQYIGDNTRFVKDSFETISKVLQGQAELCAAMKANAVTPELMARHDEIVAASDLNYLCGEIPSALNQALEGIGRVSKIVKAMKEFSHPGSKEKAAVNLNKAIENTVTIARHEWHYVADVNLELEPDLPLVQCYSGEFNQCILNLVVNAAHAIGDVIKQRPDTKGLITVRTRRDLDQVEVRVTDTGTGIPEAARSKIFEPFFTTKMVGKGTGQGLSIVYANIVKKHGGTVTFETETGKGTSFIVRLPITAAPAPVAS